MKLIKNTEKCTAEELYFIQYNASSSALDEIKYYGYKTIAYAEVLTEAEFKLHWFVTKNRITQL